MVRDQSVEVIIPVYNNLKALKRCLKALSRQVLDNINLNITVVDNASCPPIYDLSCEFPLVSIIICDTPGSYAARNAAAIRSTANVIVFLDSDCEPADKWLLEGVSALLRQPDRAVVGGEVLFRASVNPTATEAYQLTTGFEQEFNIRNRGFSATANLFMLRSTFESVGHFNEALLSGGDREWCWRAGRVGYLVIFWKAAAVYTDPRRSFRKAVIQTRRVAGGRFGLAKSESLSGTDRLYLFPMLGARQKVLKIVTNSSFSWWLRFRVLCVASALLVVRKFEQVRLGLGGERERC